MFRSQALTPAHAPQPPPDPRPNTEQQLRIAEQNLASEEAHLAQEYARLMTAAGGLLARLQQARAAAASALQAGGDDPQLQQLQQRVNAAQVQAVDVSAHQDAALRARAQAVEVRQKAAEAIRHAVNGWAAELSLLTSQLTADETALAGVERRLREEAQVRTLQQPPPPPPAAAPAEAPPTQVARPQGRRALPRVRMQAAIDLHSDSNFFTGFSTDLSEGGLFVATVQAPPIGTEVDLSFSLPSGQKVSVHGVVRWTREINDRTPEIFPGAGIQFVNLDPGTAGLIHRFVQAREPMFFPE